MLEQTKEVLKEYASEYGLSDKVRKEIRDVENGVKILLKLKAEYESNKHYIELGKAVERGFKNGKELFAGTIYETCGYAELTDYDRIDSTDELLEWAEGRE